MAIFTNDALAGKSVLVTGGGRGIGAAICRVLAREGAHVAVNYGKSAEKAEAVAARHPDALVLAADTVVAIGRRILPKVEDEATRDAIAAAKAAALSG